MASKQDLCNLDASSKIMSEAFLINVPSGSLSAPVIPHVGRIGIGILNLECDVLPPGKKCAAMRLAAVGNTTQSLPRNAAHMAAMTYVFPVPPRASANMRLAVR